MHSSQDQCSHLGTNALISGPMLSSRDECIHLGTNALISGPMLSSRDECIHLGTNALISGPMLSSRDQCSHLGTNALISGPMLSSRDKCSHLGINALISGSMLSSPALGGGQLKPELAQTMLQRPKEMARFLLILKSADKIIRVPNQASFALCVPFDDFMKPQIQRVMQIHIGQDR